MSNEILKRDENSVVVLGAITDDAAQEIRMVRVDPATNRILASTTGVGTGSVTSVSVVSANGFAGTVATATTTPAITLTTSITGILKGNGTAISAVTIGSGLSFDGTTLSATGGGSGTVTSVSVVTANGISGSVATATTTPAITLTLGAITPTTVNGLTITANGTNTLNITAGKTLAATNTLTLSGTDGTVMTFPSTSKTILANDLSNIGTAVANLIFTDNTYDIGASGATRPRTGYFGTSIVSPVVNATTGVQINGAAASNKILKGNGTNFVASTETYAAPGTSGNVMTSDGTNWTSAAPAGGGKIAIGTSQVDIRNTVTETNFFSQSITGGTLSTNNGIEAILNIADWDITNGTTLTLRLKYGSTTVCTMTIVSGASSFTNSGGQIRAYLFGNGTTSSQKGFLSTDLGAEDPATSNEQKSSNGGVSGTSAEDSTGALNLVISAEYNNAFSGDGITMESYIIRRIS